MVGESEKYFLLDTKPLPVLGLKRDKRHSDFAGNATPGWCAAREMRYFGYKLVMLSTWNGIPISYDILPANTDERITAEGVLEMVSSSNIYVDKERIYLCRLAGRDAYGGLRLRSSHW